MLADCLVLPRFSGELGSDGCCIRPGFARGHSFFMRTGIVGSRRMIENHLLFTSSIVTTNSESKQVPPHRPSPILGKTVVDGEEGVSSSQVVQ